jgi:hypothetical protein
LGTSARFGAQTRSGSRAIASALWSGNGQEKNYERFFAFLAGCFGGCALAIFFSFASNAFSSSSHSNSRAFSTKRRGCDPLGVGIMSIRPDPAQIIEIYLDESSQTKHRFLVMGAVLVSLPDTERLIDLITKARLPELPEREAKWTKVSRDKLPAYKRIVSVLFDNPDLATPLSVHRHDQTRP